MLLRSETASIQNQLGTFCRTGEPVFIAGTNPDRMMEYRRLVYNIINENLSNAYPISREILQEEAWEILIGTFLKDHDCQSYEVWKLPYEFYEFVVKKNFQEQLRYPFLNDLLYFEWIEIELYTLEDPVIPSYNTEGDYLHHYILFNPVFRLLHLKYPVHLHAAAERYQEGDYFILAFRHPETLEVNFLTVSILHAWLIEKITSEKATIANIIEEAVSLFSFSDINTLSNHLVTFLENLKKEGAILGFLINRF